MQQEAMTIESASALPGRANAAPAASECEECLGSGGWFRYEPALEPAQGLLYLSCLECRGTGLFGSLRRG